MRVLAKILGIGFIVALAFLVGRASVVANVSTRSGEQIQFVQAEKVRQNLSAFREVQEYLEQGCSLSAKRKVDEEIEVNVMFLAEHVQAYPDGVLVAMLKARDPGMLEQLRNQEVNWGRVYMVPECVSSSSRNEQH